MYKHILLPHDGSPLSDKALTEGIRVAKASNAKVTLLHVVAPYHAPGLAMHSSPALRAIEHQHQEELEKAARGMLESAQHSVRGQGVSCEFAVISAVSPAESIIDQANARACDLIVMSSHGRRGVEGLLVGSETVKVLTHTKTPVLVVR
jgi:nucleotide-binding universal stress UspA family protein